jgi:hypothetical protein
MAAKYRKEIESLRAGLGLTYSAEGIARHGEAKLIAHDAENLARLRDADAVSEDACAAHYRDVYCGGGKNPDMVERFTALAEASRKLAARWRKIAAVALGG